MISNANGTAAYTYHPTMTSVHLTAVRTTHELLHELHQLVIDSISSGDGDS